jgi:cell division transport system permease protein
MLNFLKRIIKYGWKIFIRDGEIALTNVFILVIVIILISFLFLSREIGQILISFLKEKADISVYFKEEVLEEDILKLEEEISKIPEVKEVKYVSKEEALNEFRERYKENPILMEALSEIGANPFLASLSIKVQEASQYEAIINFLNEKNSQIIEKIDYYQRKPLIDRIFSLISNFEKGGFFLSVILILIAILVTFNTIRLAIINYGEEISIQRLVGASNWFIRGPFIVQGVISGILAAIFSLFLLAISCWFLSPKIEVLFEGLDVFQIFSEKIAILISIQFLVGISLGVISSLIAIRRYLRV